MATYNGGAFISRQLNSFSMQERRPDELIVCDDGSTDDTREQIEAFAARAGFHVRLVRNEQRLGYNRNFAKAIGLCSGDLIFISDQDDEWYPGKLKAVASAFAADPRLAAVTNDQDIVDRDGLPAGAHGPSERASTRLSGHMVRPGLLHGLSTFFSSDL
jgi:glycosyltransferase involved in cell wall biosynthesis